MRKRILKCVVFAAIVGFGLTGCELAEEGYDEGIVGSEQEFTFDDSWFEATTEAGITEKFEDASKTSYPAGTVTLSSGQWTFTDALIGTTTSDRKTGTKSARVRNSGKLTMKFNMTNGAGTVTVYHALYGTDASTTWELYKSTNSGSSWTKVGSTVTTSSTTLKSASFTVNQTGNVRFEIRKTSGTGRLNFDDVAITACASTGGDDTGSGTGTGTGTGTVVNVPDNDNALLGNPSGAVTSTSYPDNYLMVKSQYTLAYSRSRLGPIWTSWHLSPAEIGSTARQDDFRPDTTLPSGWYQVTKNDFQYASYDFDRGHMCPSADRTKTTTDNSATFLMTNMIPQAPKNNQQTSQYMETWERNLVDQGYEMFIVAGPWGQGGTGAYGTFNSIPTSGGNIVVPAKTWKIVVLMPNGSNDLARISATTRVVAVIMPNNQTVNSKPWYDYRVSVDEVEALTGFDFMSNVPDYIENTLESAADNGTI